jgi:Fe-S cluster assembly scaffold protein SufB
MREDGSAERSTGMMQLDEIQKRLLREVADLHAVPEGAYNIRSNSQSIGRQSSANIEIVPKTDVSGLEIHIKPGTKNESVHIPVVMTQTGLKELVYNDFFIGDDADVVIVAGCGIDNCGNQDSEHDGIHRFYVGKNARVKYVEKHYGSGEGKGKRILNPGTEVYQQENSYVEMEMIQIKGVDDTTRSTIAELAAGAKLVVRERLMTHGEQQAVSTYNVSLNGEGASADVVSRSVARDNSFQKFEAKLVGNAACSGHTECDSIIMDKGRILAVPGLEANDVDAALVHEAAIGKIAGDQIIKLMTLGLTEAEAEEQIVNGFLK